jgi:hypothetical protein
MIDISLLALTGAWFTTVVALAVLLASLTIEQDWNSAVYWRALPQALELVGDEGPPPIVDQWTLEELATGACIGETKPAQEDEEARLKRIEPLARNCPFQQSSSIVTRPACAPSGWAPAQGHLDDLGIRGVSGSLTVRPSGNVL